MPIPHRLPLRSVTISADEYLELKRREARLRKALALMAEEVLREEHLLRGVGCPYNDLRVRTTVERYINKAEDEEG